METNKEINIDEITQKVKDADKSFQAAMNAISEIIIGAELKKIGAELEGFINGHYMIKSGDKQKIMPAAFTYNSVEYARNWRKDPIALCPNGYAVIKLTHSAKPVICDVYAGRAFFNDGTMCDDEIIEKWISLTE